MLINVNKALKRKDFSKVIKLYQNCKLCTKRGEMCNFYAEHHHNEINIC